MRLWTYSLREVQRRPGRTLLTLLGIAIGVAVSVATTMSVGSAHRAYRTMFESVAGKASLEVVAPGLVGFDGAVAARLRSLPGVSAIIPRVQVWAALVGPSGSVPVLLLGMDPAGGATSRDLAVRQGQAFGSREGAWLPAGFAEAQGLRPGQPVRLGTPAGTAELPLCGTLAPQEITAANGGAVVFLPLPVAQRLAALGRQINNIQIILDADAERDTVREAAAARLPAGLAVQAPGAGGALARTTLLSAELGLNVLSLVASVAAAFVILNTCLLNLGERRRQLAVLRVLGATRSQIRRLLLRETVLLGLAGSVLGLGAGLGLAVVLRGAVAEYLGVGLPGSAPSGEALLVALLLGPGIALAAGLFPVREAARRRPLEELLGRQDPGEDRPCRRTALVGLALLAVCLGLEIGLLAGWFPAAVSQTLLAPGIGLFLVGCTLLLPRLLPVLLAGLARLLRPGLGVAGQLAVRQLARNRKRTCLTAGVLFIAIVVAIGFGTTLLNILDDVQHWYRQTVVADFMVRGSMPDTSFVMATALPDSLAAQLARLDGVERVDRIAFFPASVRGKPVLVLARTFAPGRPLPLDIQDGEPAAVRRGLVRGEVAIGSALAHQLGLGPGSLVELPTPHGGRQVRVAATVTEYVGGGSALYMEWGAARRLLEVPGAHVLLVMAQPGRTAALAPALRRFCGKRGLVLQSNEDLRVLIEGQLARLVGILWVLIVLAFLVASLGIVNTLTMNVLEQTRQLGILRALGMGRGQVRKMVLAQAVLTGLVSLVPGVAVGLGLAYLVSFSTGALLGQQVPFRLEWPLVAGCFVMALGIGVLAALLPARRAGRVRVIQALQGP